MTPRTLLLSYTIACIVIAGSLSGCSSGSASSNDAALSRVGHRWVVQNESGLLCYDSREDLETARGMGGNFEDMTPPGFQNTGDESAGGRLMLGDIISVDAASDDYYTVTPIKASVVNEGKSCAVDIAKLQLSPHNADKTIVMTWHVGTVYKGANEIEPCFTRHDLAAAQYDAEVNSEGTGNGDQSLSVSDDPDDPARYRLERIGTKVLTFYVITGDRDVSKHGYTIRRPHAGEMIYCSHENKPQ